MVEKIAELLGVLFIKIDMSSTTLAKLQGEQKSGQVKQGKQDLEELVGKLALEIVRSGVSNPLVFFDEANLNANNMASYMKFLLQASPVLNVPSCNIKIPLNRINLIFASNDVVKDAALAQRFPIITFQALTEDQKIAAASEKFSVIIERIKTQHGDEFAGKVQNVFDH
ncbi:hypothetical protein D3871_25515 [Noviherbaspirillum saxi]|uniref:ATPase AAA-type core domain-containing protein n=2 Tax=Noviherbaspirillum saxi TaxID=2320863 RepID=A0A3A3FFA9_9BURK|nr:hypothetical protein D3871_25515 [Noviherbaspirillum saxi]